MYRNLKNLRKAEYNMERRNAWLSYDEKEEKELELVAKSYRSFLDAGKTERECVSELIRQAEAAGYVSLEEKIASGEQIKAGDKIYAEGMKKILAFFHVGQEPLEKGMNILGAHIDSPRIDIKQNPLYEDTDLAYLDTHYYGGVKKYQWVALPLAIHGVIVKKDGTVAEVNVGEDEEDPVVYITDLLIHLAGKQMQKKAAEVIEGENLDILIGSRPLSDLPDDKKKEAVKENILKLLKEKYDVEEEDFLSAELEIVPAGKARDCGLDRSMVAGYGQDDRVCAYTSFLAMLEMENPKRTSCCLLTDKEEIGSVGATGMQSRFFENSVAELLEGMGCYSEMTLRRTLKNSFMLSSDVSAGYDPAYGEAFEKKNAAYLGRGIVLNKFTGSRGKSGSNDANAEYVAKVRKIFDDHEIAFQTAELGKVDVGGGGTIAFICALYGMNVIDSGVSVLSMHAPWEVTSKADIYEAKKAYKAFLLDA
jgi:aspartyl aminopeptidase